MANNPEQYLISAVLNSQDHITPGGRGITRKFFSAYEDEWKFIEQYIRIHKRTPSKAAFKKKFPNFGFKKVDDVEHYCEEVREAHAQERMTSSIQEIIADIESGDVKKALKKMHKSALEIESQVEGLSEDSDVISNWRDTYDEAMRRIARKESTGQAGIPTGFPTLDERTGGPMPGHVWIWAARLGQGKTQTLIRCAAAACFSGHVVQYDALEGSRQDIAMRFHTFASSEYGKEVFKNSDLQMGKNFSPRGYKEFLQSLRNDVTGKLHIADATKGPVSPLTIAAQIEKNKPDVLFLDYITLMDSDDGGDDWQGKAKLSKQIKNTAEKYQVPFMIAAQLNRSAPGGKEMAGPENLAESDSFGRDADAVITLKQLSKHVVAMKLVKYRHGRDGFTWYCRFLPNTGHFEEITFDKAQEIIAEDRDNEESDENFKFKPRQKGSFKALQEQRQKYILEGGKNASATSKRRVVNEKGKKTSKKTAAAKKRVVVKKK